MTDASGARAIRFVSFRHLSTQATWLLVTDLSIAFIVSKLCASENALSRGCLGSYEDAEQQGIYICVLH